MKLILALLMLVAVSTFAQPTTTLPSVQLGWDQSPDPAVNGYRLYWGISPGVYTNSVAVIGRATTTATVANLVRGTTYYFVATCTATNGLESAYSSPPVVYTTTPLPLAPQNVRVTVLTP